VPLRNNPFGSHFFFCWLLFRAVMSGGHPFIFQVLLFDVAGLDVVVLEVRSIIRPSLQV
jgi:hypothetical protein